MALIRPFRGLRYDPAVVGPLASVIAPPYDVIGKPEQARLYDASPYNVVRLDLAREADRYASSARLFREWRASGALVRDPEPAVYAYAQRYRLKDGTAHERWGFFASLRLEELGEGVLPHERTLPTPKADRLELQRATRANLSPIFGLYSAPGFRARDLLEPAAEALEDVPDSTGVVHRFGRVTDPRAIAELVRRVADRRVYIADGHHRYETALRYRDERRAAGGGAGGDPPFDWVLVYLANVDEPGLTVLPTHRLLRDLGMPAWSFVVRLRESFLIEEVAAADGPQRFLAALAATAAGERRIGVALRGWESRLVLVHREGGPARPGVPPVLASLDVALLHELVIGGILDLNPRQEVDAGNLLYTKDDEEALARFDAGELAAAFLLNATRVDEVRAVSEAGEVMPEKSTYFHPKLATGLVFHDVEEA